MERLAGAQLQLLGVGIEVGLEVRDRYTVGVLIVDAETAADVDMFHADAVTLELVLQFVDAIAESLKVAHVENLTADVEVEPDNLDVLQLAGVLNDGHHVAHGDAELILGQSGGDVGVGVGTYVGVQSEGHAGHLALGGSQLVDDLELGDALDVEAEDVAVEPDVDFPVGLADAGEDNLRAREASLDAGLNLAAADAVGTQACLTDDGEQAWVDVGLDGVVDVPPFVAAGLGVDGA